MALALAGILLGVLFLSVGSDYLPPVIAWRSKRALQGLFRRADRFEVHCGRWPPGEIDKPHLLGVVTRKENPARWETWIDDMGKAREAERYAMSSNITLQLLRGPNKLGEVLWLGSVRQMTPVLPGRRFAAVEFDSSLHVLISEVARPEGEAWRRYRRALAAKPAKVPAPPPSSDRSRGRAAGPEP